MSMSRIHSLISRSVTIAILGSTALTVRAQTPASAEEAELLEEVVVTASRQETLLSKTPIAVTSVSSESLRNANITNPTQLADMVPNLAIVRGNGLQITIRGVTSTDNTEKGDPSAAFMVNGIYISRAQAQEASFFDLERVEVLRGPQGTLYGRNTTAGVVNVISAKPKKEFGASADVTLADFNTRQVTGMINLPVSDSFALRAAVNYDRRDSFAINNAGSPFSLDPFKDNLSFRLSGLMDLTDKLKLLLVGDYTKLKGSTTQGVPTSNFFVLPLVAAPANQAGTDPVYYNASSTQRRNLGYSELTAGNPWSVQPRRDNSTSGLMADLSYALTDRMTLAYLGSFRNFKRNERITNFAGSTVVSGVIVSNTTYPQSFTGEYKQDSHELRLAYDGDRMDAQLGVYYFHESSGIEFLIYGQNGTPGTRGYVFGFPQDPTVAKSLAFFGQSTYSLTDTLRLTVGARYTTDDKSRVGNTIFHVNVGDPLDYTTGPNATVNPLGRRDSLNNASAKFGKGTWKLGLDYDLTDDTLLYGTVSTGYKAGGFNDGCEVTTPNCFAPAIRSHEALYYQPETLIAYEVGFRTKLAGNRAQVNGNLFHYDYDNLQLSQLRDIGGGALGNVTTNASSAKVDGVELEGVLVPNIRNRFDFSIAMLNARYADFTPIPGVSFAGKPLDRSPAVVLSAGYVYTLPFANGGNMQFGLRSRYSDKYYMYSGTLRAFFNQPSFVKTDATVTYNAPDEAWYIQAFGKNLEDKVTVTGAGVATLAGLNNGGAQFADPRVFGVRAGVKF